MRGLLVLSTLLVLACGAPQRAVSKLDGRIVGGEDISIEEVPYQISLLYFQRHICGGSIIAERYIITAAHCTRGSVASDLAIRAGSSIRESGGDVVAVKEIFQHPDFSSGPTDFDISVLYLASALQFGARINSIALPYQDQDVVTGSKSLVTGWGTLSSGGPTPTHLQGVVVPIVCPDVCREAYGKHQITDRMICAGVPEGGKDSCQGDSGGPLVINNELIGIVSWGYGCAIPGYPGIYASVPNLRRFITTSVGI